MLKRNGKLFLMLVIMAMIIAACGGGGNTNSGGGTEKPREPLAPQPATEQEKGAAENSESDTKDDTFTIRIGGWFIDDRPFMVAFKQNIEEQYKAMYPNATIQWDILLGSTYFDKLKAEVASKTAPDVFFHNVLGEFAEAGLIMDLSDQAWVEHLLPAAKQLLTVDGKVYAGALGQGAAGFWYNKDLYAQLGLVPPSTWAELLDNAEKIKEANITPVALGFKDQWTAGSIFNGMLQSEGYQASATYGRDLYEGTKQLTGEEVQTVLTRLQEMTERGYFNKNALSSDWPQAAEMLSSGQAAHIFIGQYLPGAIQDNFNTKGHEPFELGYFPAPTDSPFYSIAAGVNEIISVNAGTQLKQEAMDLVSVVLSEQTISGYSSGNGSIPIFDNINVSYANNAQNELLAAIGKGDVSLGVQLFIAKSAWTDIEELVSKIISGVNYTTDDLEEIQKKHDRDKESLVVPQS